MGVLTANFSVYIKSVRDFRGGSPRRYKDVALRDLRLLTPRGFWIYDAQFPNVRRADENTLRRALRCSLTPLLFIKVQSFVFIPAFLDEIMYHGTELHILGDHRSHQGMMYVLCFFLFPNYYRD